MEKLIQKYNKEIAPKLKKELGLKNNFLIPKIIKVTVSAGIGDFKDDDAAIKKISDELAKITGQKPKLNLSKKAVSSFKLRIGQPVGLTVTLRGEKMYDFIDRLVSVALPRVRDFRGLSKKGFDGNGNYSIGIREYMIFPEVKYEEATRPFGFQVNIKTNTENDEQAKLLLSEIGFPFERKQNNIKSNVSSEDNSAEAKETEPQNSEIKQEADPLKDTEEQNG